LGRIIASGVVVTGKVLGINRIPACKGQSLAAYDPRAIKGLGVTYSTSPMGADHTTGPTLRAQVEHTKPEKQMEASREAQIINCIHDSIGTCFFMSTALKGNLQLLSDAISGILGITVTMEQLRSISKDSLIREREFNYHAGIKNDTLPEFFYLEKNPETDSVFDVPQEEIDKTFEFYPKVER